MIAIMRKRGDSMSSCNLVIDLGGTMTKIVIFDYAGKKLAMSKFETERVSNSKGFATLDLKKYQEKLFASIKNLLVDTKIDSSNIKGITCVGHGKGLYIWGEHGEIYPGILSVDQRGKEVLESLLETEVKLLNMHNKNIFLSSQAPFLLLWLKMYEREVYDQIEYIFSAKDFTRFLLTDSYATDYTDASSNGWIDLETNMYNKELINILNLNELQDKLPEILLSTELGGRITKKCHEATGLLEGTPVFVGAFDVDACALGAQVLSNKELSLTAGTWAVNALVDDKPYYERKLILSKYLDGERFLICSPSPTSAGNLSIILKNIAPDLLEGSEDVYTYLDETLVKINPELSNVVFLPYLYGTNSSKFKEAVFSNVVSTTTRNELLLAVYEGIAFSHKYHVDQLLDKKNDIECIRLSGGASKSPFWLQLFADILAYPIEVCSEDEVGALGGAMLCAVGLKYYETIEMASQNMSSITKRVLPNLDKSKIYEVKYQSFLRLMKG